MEMDPISAALKAADADAFVMYANSRDADMRYLTRFTTSDAFVFFQKPDEQGVIIVSQMETTRASRESPAVVMTRTQAGLPEILKTEKDPLRATAKMIAGTVGKKILVPSQFPIGLAEALREHCTIIVDNGSVPGMRAIKTRTEIQTIKRIQQLTDKAMGLAISLIASASVKKGILSFKGIPLTSEQVKFVMHRFLLEHGCSAVDTIVSCGKDTAIPHMTGNGPLMADEPIIIDIFPVEEKTGYCADMTRTIVKGEPSPDIRDMFTTLRDAKHLALQKTKAGVSGATLYSDVVDYFADHGYESNTRGFVHNLGHGVGLQVHELPTVGPSGGALEAGNVITIEPGLYYPGIGGVRLEDMGAVTRTGFSNFTKHPEDLVV